MVDPEEIVNGRKGSRDAGHAAREEMVGSDRSAPLTRGDLSGRDAQSDHSTPGCREASLNGTFSGLIDKE